MKQTASPTAAAASAKVPGQLGKQPVASPTAASGKIPNSLAGWPEKPAAPTKSVTGLTAE